MKLARADADWVREATGFAIGGVAPVGHRTPPLLLLDEDLLALDPVWAAAGSPSHVFRTSAAELRRITGAAVAGGAAGWVNMIDYETIAPVRCVLPTAQRRGCPHPLVDPLILLPGRALAAS